MCMSGTSEKYHCEAKGAQRLQCCCSVEDAGRQWFEEIVLYVPVHGGRGRGREMARLRLKMLCASAKHAQVL